MLRSNRWDIIYQYPTVMQRLTASVYHLEWYGPFLLLIPRKNHRWRGIVFGSFSAFHIWLGITMLIWYFPYVCIMGRLALTPTRFRERVWPSTWAKNIVTHRRSYLLSSFLIICLVYIALRNLRANNFERREKHFPTTINKFGFLLRLDQYWSMFSPYPVEDDGWFVIKGTTARGQEVNLLDKWALVSYDKPKDFSRLYPDEKWRKYFLNMWQKWFDSYRPYYLKWQCRERNKQYPDNKLTRTSMEYVTERTRADYQVDIEGPTLLAVVDCRDMVK